MRIWKTGVVVLATLAAQFFLRGAAAAAVELNPTIWEKDIAAFETMDRTNWPPKGAVLFVGSSSIRFWTNLANDFPEWKVIRRGFGGSHLPDVTYFADRIVIPYRPSKIVLYAGDNDIAKGRSAKQVAQDFRAFVKKVHSELPETKIYCLAIKPSASRWHLSPQAMEANRLVRGYCRGHRKLEFIDVWTPILGADGRPNAALFQKDNLHLNEAGYARWIPVIRKALKD
jgi:lysophospholipase L1-like esterase